MYIIYHDVFAIQNYLQKPDFRTAKKKLKRHRETTPYTGHAKYRYTYYILYITYLGCICL